MSTSLTLQPGTANEVKVETSSALDFFEQCKTLTNRIAARAFELCQERGADGRARDDWFRAESELLWPVPIEMIESDKDYTIRAEVPGFEAKDLKIRVEPSTVHIHGTAELKEEKKGKEVKYSEIREVCRRIDLPTSVNAYKGSAHLKNGILELVLPKAAPQKLLEVKAA